MREKTFTFYDGFDEEIFVYVWSPDYFDWDNIDLNNKEDEKYKKIKGVLLISHGMAEHAKRYDRFAKYLTDNNYIVFANDHRGHYKTAKSEDKQGIFYKGDIKSLKNSFNESLIYESLNPDFNNNILHKNLEAIFKNFIRNAKVSSLNESSIDYGNKNNNNSNISNNNVSLKNNIDLNEFADKIITGWDLVLFDMFLLNLIIKSVFDDKQLIILGHSMGSLLTRNYVITFSDFYNNLYNKIILTGTSSDPGALGQIGMLITKLIILFNGKNKKSPLLNKLSFGKFNDQFKPNKTEFDWLSTDENEVKKYIDDPWSGFIAKAGFFYDLLKGVFFVNKIDNVKKIDKSLPIFILSGGNDPVGENGKGVKTVYELYKKAGLNNVSLKLYQDFRHEILNETNRDQVFYDILKWLAT